MAAISLFAAACGVMESHSIGPDPAPDAGTACASDLGSYALPKGYLHIKVVQAANAPPDILFADKSPHVETIRHPDRSLVFCLDYLKSALAHDVIKIQKSPISGTAGAQGAPDSGHPPVKPFLSAVSINATDLSTYVIETLLQAAFVAASNNPQFANYPNFRDTSTPAPTVADLEYDPFDPEESASVNARLTKLGICLVLEDYTFPRRGPGVDGYCNAPRAQGSGRPLVTQAYLDAERSPADPHSPGLLYRPRLPYRLEVYRKPDPGGRHRWRLSETISVELENLSPVLALDIHRAAFAQRKAYFLFDEGALKRACVAKGSELEGFVDIPLQISKSLVELPGAIVSVQIDSLGNQKKLVDAEQQLVQVQQAYLTALSSGKYSPSGQGTNLPSVPDVISNLPSPPATPVAAAPAYASDLFSTAADQLCGGS